MSGIAPIVADVVAEIDRVDAIRGTDLRTTLGTGGRHWCSVMHAARADYDAAERAGCATMALALREEVYEALAETDPAKLRAELVQVASVALRMIRNIDAAAVLAARRGAA